MSAIPADLDHIVFAVPDLEAGARDFAERTGLTPIYGGAHKTLGTANYLVPLIPVGWPADSRTYLEIIGPDPDSDIALASGQMGNSASPRLQHWAIHPADYDARLAAARVAGVPVGTPRNLSRNTPEGTLLQWRLTMAQSEDTGEWHIPHGGALPFLIDWQDAQHPSERLRGDDSASLTAIEFFDPAPQSLQDALAVVGIHADVASGPEAGLVATLTTPNGEVVLTSR